MGFNFSQFKPDLKKVRKNVSTALTPQNLKNHGGNLLFFIKNYFSTTYKTLWIVSIITTVYGLMFVYSATQTFETNRQFTMQVIACVIGYAGALLLSTVDYQHLGELWCLVAGICLFLVALTFVPGIGYSATEMADDQAWIKIAGVSFQPAELVKIGFIITFSYHLSKVVDSNKINSFTQLILLGLHAAVPVGLIAMQGDHGSAIIFLFMFIILIVCAGIKWYYILLGFVAIGAALPLVWMNMQSFQKNRIRAVYNPQPGDEIDILWQQNLSKTAIGSGGINGAGYMQGPISQSKINPEKHNDFIFSVIGEETGFIGSAFAILLLLALMILCIRVALISKDSMGRFMCIGYFSVIATQTVLNIGMCLGVLPVIGITLPFFSAGGSASMCMFFGLGLVAGVYMRRNDDVLQFS